MTGYARGESRGRWGTLTVELRSINHRYLETGFRLPEPLRGLEAELRRQIGGRIKRGKVDVAVRLDAASAAAGTLTVDYELAAAVAAAARSVATQIEKFAPLDPLDLLRWPGVVREPAVNVDELAAAAADLLAATLEDLVANRRAEGARIDTMLRERAATIGGYVAAVRARLPAVREQLRVRLLTRLQELNLTPDDDRLSQELVYTAQRIDVAEELDRLDSHIAELEKALQRSEPVGRRLDFLMQEFNREANTLASKSQDTETTQAAIEIKVLIEQMREQVQNVE
ncbi:MAG TPA: YicC/YloC family endoribonuclease [Gammaproteobacteria bacterium]|nr:YicC/YloC family endoribonuclease [Gammaproteobacteria bacterium]